MQKVFAINETGWSMKLEKQLRRTWSWKVWSRKAWLSYEEWGKLGCLFWSWKVVAVAYKIDLKKFWFDPRILIFCPRNFRKIAKLNSKLNRNFPTSDFPTPHSFQQHFPTTYPTFQYQFYFPAYIDLSNISNSFPTSMVFQVNWKLSNFNSWHFPESLFPISSRTFRL